MPKKCRHCRKAVAHRPRRLCWCCWHDKAIRDLYPTAEGYYGDDDPSAEALDAMVKAQLPTMPATILSEPARWRLPVVTLSSPKKPMRRFR
jgi:hypothetical protein